MDNKKIKKILKYVFKFTAATGAGIISSEIISKIMKDNRRIFPNLAVACTSYVIACSFYKTVFNMSDVVWEELITELRAFGASADNIFEDSD